MPFDIKDEIINYSKIAKEVGLADEFGEKVETHLVSIKIVGECPAVLVNLIRYFVCFAYPTRRMVATPAESSHPDQKPLIEAVMINLSEMKFSHDCPLGKGKFFAVHDKPFQNPLLITSKMLKERDYTNKHKITTLDKGCTFAFDYEIVEKTGVESGQSYHYFASTFDRTETEEIEKTLKGGDKIAYNTGTFKFTYTDNVTGSDVFGKVKALIYATIDEILNNFDKHFLLALATPYLIVPNDRSGIIANCISVYVFAENQSIFAIQEYGNNKFICKYPKSTPDEIKEPIMNALKKIKSDLN